MEQYGSQHGSYPASRIHDGLTDQFWLSNQNNYDNYFIFSFENEEAEIFNLFRLVNYGNNNRAVQSFMLFSSSEESAKTDPADPSWSKIGIYRGGSTDLLNVVNSHLGGMLEDYGSQHGSYPA
ncbi:MAG: hypothetical protein JW928_08535, partial [Candidatus Aureabacteria bacterium]|nr:hypothetical protein [Candidatus Auribacterota bacterium]